MKKILIALAFILLTSSSVWAVPLLQDQQIHNNGLHNNGLYERQEKFRCAEGFSTGRYDANGNEICKDNDLILPPLTACTIANCQTCNVSGKACTACVTGYVLSNGKCILDGTRGPILEKPISIGTVSSCPSGTTKSSDGCCCVNN